LHNLALHGVFIFAFSASDRLAHKYCISSEARVKRTRRASCRRICPFS